MAQLVLSEIDKHSDLFLLKLAREIAIDHYTLEEIKHRYAISPEQWHKIINIPRFHSLLESEIISWQGAANTHDRTKLKAAAIVELWLEEATTKMHDPQENLPAKVELAKLVTRIAGMGIEKMGVEGETGTRFQVTINLGADQKLSFDKQVSSKVIEGEAVDM